MKNFLFTNACIALLLVTTVPAATNTSDSRLLRPLSLAEALDIALQQNSSILKSKADLKASHGIEVQTRAIVLPRVNIGSQYTANERSATDRFRPSTTGSASNAILTRAFEF